MHSSQSSTTDQQRLAAPRQWLGYALVLLAGALWACLGLFFRILDGYNLPAETIAFDRTVIAGLTLLALTAIRQPQALRIKRADSGYFALYGLCIAGFFLIYIYAVKLGGVALAAVLLYTAPFWIVVFAWLRWGEALTPVKLGAMALAVTGCALVALGGTAVQGGLGAILVGLLTGLAYAWYSLLSNEGLRRGYSPSTIVTYALLGAALCLLPFQDWSALARAVATPGAWPALLGVALVSTLLAPVCYAAGQQRIGASTAGIIATVEPVLAALLAWILIDESLSLWQIVGGLCVLGAVVLLLRAPVPAPQPAPGP